MSVIAIFVYTGKQYKQNENTHDLIDLWLILSSLIFEWGVLGIELPL